MLRRAGVLLLTTLMCSGCDRITGAADLKVSDAEAIGYACRVSLKKPEDCMKENDAQSPTAILAGWKAADKDIVDKSLDPSMGQDKIAAAHAAAASAAAAAATQDKGDDKSAEKSPSTKSH